jgi:hypothetical protein
MNRKNTAQSTSSMPKDPKQAAEKLIKLSRSLVDLAERETQALVQNDIVTFAILQDEKEFLTGQYAAASEEFRSRLEEFRSLDRAVLARLEELQKRLAEKTHANNAIVMQMRQRAVKNTQSTLLSAQELGQRNPVNFENKQQEGM